MEKFALLNLLRALDGLQGKKPAGENGAGDGSINGNISADGAFKGGDALGGLGGNEGLAADGGSDFDGLGGILGNLLKGGLFGGAPFGGQNNSAGNFDNGFGAGRTDSGNGGNKGGFSETTQPNVMASVLERHEAMANRVRNKK